MNLSRFFCFGLLIIVGITYYGCDNADPVKPLVNDEAPAKVKNVKVHNIAGGARITYDLPDSKSLQSVKVVFKINDKEKREVKASRYNNKLVVEGFPDTSAYEGELYAISRGENQSEPVSVTIHPLLPSYLKAYNSIKTKEAFGGVQVNFENENEGELVISVLAPDSVDGLIDAKKFYTENKDGKFYARGFPSKETKFGVYVLDRWEHSSDTLYTTLKPLYEEEIDKSTFTYLGLPNDTVIPFCCGAGVISVWDNRPVEQVSGFHTLLDAGIPLWFTFDMNKKVRLSRLKLFSLPDRNDPYQRGDPKKFEIWGSNNPAPDGSFDSWTKLGSFKDEIPSGQESSTEEDWLYATREGKDFEVEDSADLPPVRYLRVRVTETWGGVSFMYINELTFWGKVVN